MSKKYYKNTVQHTIEMHDYTNEIFVVIHNDGERVAITKNTLVPSIIDWSGDAHEVYSEEFEQALSDAYDQIKKAT